MQNNFSGKCVMVEVPWHKTVSDNIILPGQLCYQIYHMGLDHSYATVLSTHQSV